MAERHTLRRYIMFQAIIQGVRNPARAVDRLFRDHPDWDPEERRSYEAWKDDFTPTFGVGREVESTTIKGDVL